MVEKGYLVIKCPACGTKHVIPSSYATKRCSKCNRLLRVASTTISKHDSAEDARKSISEKSQIRITTASDLKR